MMQMLRRLMPIAASIIGGPAGALASQALSGVAKRLGLPDDSTAEQVEQHLIAHPELHAEMRKADQDFALRLNEVVTQDRQAARESYLKNRDWIAGMVAVSVAAAFLGSIGGLFYMAYHGIVIDSGMEMLVGTIIGNITGMMISKVNFFWGASKGADKGDTSGRS